MHEHSERCWRPGGSASHDCGRLPGRLILCRQRVLLPLVRHHSLYCFIRSLGSSGMPSVLPWHCVCPALCNTTWSSFHPFSCSPQGYYCAGNTALRKACPAGSFNQLLGMDAQGDCTDCSPTTQADPKFTSFLGAAYCTAPYFERNCTGAPCSSHKLGP